MKSRQDRDWRRRDINDSIKSTWHEMIKSTEWADNKLEKSKYKRKYLEIFCYLTG